MYKFIRAMAGPRWANLLSPLAYVLMLLAILVCMYEPQAEFRYLLL